MLYTKYVPGRFDLFAAAVLRGGDSREARQTLRSQFDIVLDQVMKVVRLEQDTMSGGVIEGFGRLDALNRIGNRVFGLDMDVRENYVPRTAPVHYPHIWNAPRFTWVQYNGSIMQPMVRNAGEALGVGAGLKLSTRDATLFDSTVQVRELSRIERLLAGTPPYPAGAFSGLRSPAWPASIFGAPDKDQIARGSELYQHRCRGCHLPPPTSKEFWTGKWWTQIDGKGERYLDLVQIPLDEIGTDPQQARGMAARTIALPAAMRDLPAAQAFNSTSFGPALGRLVENVTTHWYDSRKPPMTAAERDVMNGERPNELRVDLSYKARPLNGIWATPPYLHNGSVPSLYALLSPVSERPKVVWLGGREYDPDNVGYRNEAIPNGFSLDTGLDGNRNTGHEFRDAPHGGGVIGPGLSPDERRALIAYLKTL